MRCPICKRETVWEGNPFHPFCSARCKWIDLDNWLSGRYRITTPLGAEDEDEDAGPADPAKEDGG